MESHIIFCNALYAQPLAIVALEQAIMTLITSYRPAVCYKKGRDPCKGEQPESVGI